MDLNEAFNFLNFWVNKKTGAWYSIDELAEIVDRGQISYYTDIKPQYATSTLIKETLAPFKDVYNFTPTNTISGYIVIPSNLNYLDLLDVQITYTDNGRTVYRGIKMVNEDERAVRLNSQTNPVNAENPIGEIVATRYIKIYPTSSGYTGSVTYLRRPIKPVYAYTVISGRVINYDAVNSVQLEWKETDINKILLKALQSIGINLSDQEIQQWSQIKTQENFIGQNRL